MNNAKNKLKIAIVGLGLIGGSMAKSIKLHTENIVFGADNNAVTIGSAITDGAINGELTDSNLAECDIVLVCLYPNATIDYVTNNIEKFRKGAVVLDCSGVKGNICEALSGFCKSHGCEFVGSHPMAGIEKTGYDSSFAHMFDGATMVVCQDEYTSEKAIKFAENFYHSIRFDKITYSTPVEHDRAIAFTSQLAHVVSSAYVQSSQAENQMSFSGGSYKDLTRVAKLNEVMWTELFIENKAALSIELRELIARLNSYADAIEDSDEATLMQLLENGTRMKNIVG